jgi:hypothetical protein
MDNSAAAVAYAHLPIYGALIFWSFVTIVSVAAIFKEFAHKREVQRTLRTAIEKGQSLDPAVVALLTSAGGGVVRSELFAVWGIIVSAVGGGLLILGFFIGKLAPPAFYPIEGAGCLVLAIGLGLIAAAVFLRRMAIGGRDRPM